MSIVRRSLHNTLGSFCSPVEFKMIISRYLDIGDTLFVMCEVWITRLYNIQTGGCPMMSECRNLLSTDSFS